jgi:D-3-phosphoglycerate dehydrogenase
MAHQVLVTDKLAQEALDLLENEEGINLTVKTGLSEDELVNEIPSHQALIVRSGTQVTKKVIDAGTNLKVIGRAGVGVDNIDCDAAKQKEIVVMNAPLGNVNSAAEHTVAMMMALSRNIPQAHLSLLDGKWERKKFVGSELKGKTLGIIGVGHVGCIVSKIAKGLDMRVIGFDKYVNEEKCKDRGVEKLSLEEVYKEADYIVIALKLTPETKDYLDKEEFKQMKDGVRIINVARGGLVNEEALAQAIKNGKVAGAAIDVWTEEPPKNSPLIGLDQVVITPHLGASTREAQVRVGTDIAGQVINALKNGEVKFSVNQVNQVKS